MSKLKSIGIIILGIIVLSLNSCQKKPVAGFTMSSESVAIGDTVNFTNTSVDADHYEWYFGDGVIVTSVNASHVFKQSGIIPVRLSSYSANGEKVDVYVQDIEVIGATLQMKVYKMFYGSTDNVYDCTVKLYDTYSDYQNSTNVVATGVTDTYGMVEFKNLLAKKYYFDCYKESTSSYYSNKNTTISTTLVYDSINTISVEVEEFEN